MKKNLLKKILISIIVTAISYSSVAYASSHKPASPGGYQPQPTVDSHGRPHVRPDTRPHHGKPYCPYCDNYYFSHEERVAKIEGYLARHKELDNGSKDSDEVNFLRNAIIRLLPNSLDEDVVKVAYERNGLFERAVDNALKKMERNNKLGYDVTTKRLFGVEITFVK